MSLVIVENSQIKTHINPLFHRAIKNTLFDFVRVRITIHISIIFIPQGS